MIDERRWYIYSEDGSSNGPYTAEEIRGWIEQGILASNNYAWAEGMTEWVALSDLPELRTSPAPSLPTPRQSRPPAPQPAHWAGDSTSPQRFTPRQKVLAGVILIGVALLAAYGFFTHSEKPSDSAELTPASKINAKMPEPSEAKTSADETTETPLATPADETFTEGEILPFDEDYWQVVGRDSAARVVRKTSEVEIEGRVSLHAFLPPSDSWRVSVAALPSRSAEIGPGQLIFSRSRSAEEIKQAVYSLTFAVAADTVTLRQIQIISARERKETFLETKRFSAKRIGVRKQGDVLEFLGLSSATHRWEVLWRFDKPLAPLDNMTLHRRVLFGNTIREMSVVTMALSGSYDDKDPAIYKEFRFADDAR